MSSENPIADAAEGVTKAVIKVTAEGIKQLAEKLRERKYIFVEDPEVIKKASEERKTSEWNLFKTYVDDKKLRILFHVGVALRGMEREKGRMQLLRDRIKRQYGTEGLHIAELIQNGFFNRFLANALGRTQMPEQLKIEIKNLLDNIEKDVVFVKEGDNVDYLTKEIITRLHANSPKTFIICSSGWAVQKFRQIEELMKKMVHMKVIRYDYESYESEYTEVLFLNKSE